MVVSLLTRSVFCSVVLVYMVGLYAKWVCGTQPKVWTHYKIGKLNMWTSLCNVCINFLNSQIWKDIMLFWVMGQSNDSLPLPKKNLKKKCWEEFHLINRSNNRVLLFVKRMLKPFQCLLWCRNYGNWNFNLKIWKYEK